MLLTALLALLAGYLLTPFWAVDSGMALLGFFKFLPAALFWLLLMQLGPEVRERLFLTIPVSGITMTLLSYPTRWIPALTPYFYASGRLGGFFQYSNSFALFSPAGGSSRSPFKKSVVSFAWPAFWCCCSAFWQRAAARFLC